MPNPGLALAGASIASTAIGASSASKAAKAQENAANRAAETQLQATQLTVDEQRRQYDQSREDLAPYRDAGYGALGAQNYLLGLGEKPEGYGGFEASPGYQFRLDEGNKALERNAAARGMRLSGSTMKDFMRFGQGVASDEFGNHYNRLAGVSGTGQTATNTTAQLGANMAGNVGNALMSGAQARGNAYQTAGNARAAGALGVNNALQGGIGNGVELFMMNRMMGGDLFGGGSGNALFGGNSWG